MSSIERPNPTSLSSVDEHHKDVLKRTDDLLEALQLEIGAAAEFPGPAHEWIARLEAALKARDRELAEMSERSEAMAHAQADAIVHSAEIIDELERTKQRLSHARAAAEDAARDTQRLADTIFEKTNDGVLVIRDGACIACNDNALNLLSCGREEVIGCLPHTFKTARFEDGSSAADELAQLLRQPSGRQELEVCLYTRDDRTFWAEIAVNCFSMKDAGHLLVVVRDITSRKEFEEELKSHRDFLDNIINTVPDQLAVTTSEKILVVANDAFCTAHGVERKDIVGRDSSDLSGDLLSLNADLIGELSAGRCSTTEHCAASEDGSPRRVSVKRSMFKDRSSGDRFVVSAARDITEDRQREDRLRLFASVFNSASEGVAILSTSGQVEEANPAFLSMLNAHENEPANGKNASQSHAVGRRLSDLLAIEIDDFGQVLQQVVSGVPWSGKGSLQQLHLNRSHWISLSPSVETDEQTTRVIALVSDITELESTQRKLRWQALYDNLTGLPNRRFFRKRLQQLLNEDRKGEKPIAVCFVDLDDFKHVNDSAGHEKGDQLLQAVSARIQQTAPQDAFVARFGGDEFAIILVGLDHSALRFSLSAVIESFQEPFVLDDTEATVGLSVGITQYPEHADSVEGLMCNADIAMYAAKVGGKNRIQIFNPSMQDAVDMRHRVQSKLRQALADGALSLWFQPKVCATTTRPVGCEALVRWCTPAGEFIPPSEFIPIAEQTGLIGQLGTVVFEKAAIQACRWFRQNINPCIAVNVSAHQIRHPRFIEQLQKTLDETGARAEWFELEITEHAMMDDAAHTSAIIDELTLRGFRIAIDDFGTGFSSLSYLKNFRIQTLKIDMSFVQDMIQSPQSDAVVRSIISLGRGLDLTIVAEGVETAEQAKLLGESGCTLLQGYYFGPPMPADKYEEWLVKSQVRN